MHTSDVFNLNRFGLYIKKHLIDNYRLYAMSLVVLFALLLIVVVITYLTGDNFRHYNNLIPMYCIGIILSGMIFTSAAFSEFSTKPKGVDYLMLPASHFEKFITVFLFTTVGFLLVYHLAFYVMFLCLDQIAMLRSGQHMINDLNTDRGILRIGYFYPCFIWLLLQSIFLLGASYFEKYSFLKTIFLTIIVLFALFLLNAVFVKILFGNNLVEWFAHAPMFAVMVKNELASPNQFNEVKQLFLPRTMQDILGFAGKYLLIPFFWVVAYFRLKDKEI
jgi:hypothetical protein